MKKDIVIDHIDDIIANMRLAIEFTADIEVDNFVKDYRTQYAVIRALEIIGESVKRIPEESRSTEQNLPWKSMAGMRDRLIHGYDNINVELVWSTVKTTIPELLPVMEKFRKTCIVDDPE